MGGESFDGVETTASTVLGALATVLSTWLTADCAGEPDPGAELEGPVLEPAGADAELAAEPEDPDAGAELALEVAADVTLELDSDGAATLWVGELTTPAPDAPRPGAAPASAPAFVLPAPLAGPAPAGALIDTCTAPDAACRRPTRDSAKRGT